MRKVTVRDLWNYFGYRQINGDDSSLDRRIYGANVNRPGLELAGFFPEREHCRIIMLGETEMSYIEQMSEERQRNVFDHLTSEETPMILISRDLPCPEILMEIAATKNFPIFTSFAPTSSLIMEIVAYLEEFFAQVDSVHGVLLQVYGRGILITGQSGIGKSEIALELVKKGHVLVADDRVDVYRIHNHISGEAPAILKNMLELRGVGVIDIAMMFGAASTTEKTRIDFVIHLDKWDKDKEYDRLNLKDEVFNIFGVNIPKITIPVSEGRSIAVIIEAAVNDFILKSKGYDFSKILDERVVQLISQNKED
ncbi:MAG: HPr(Ser) kinase/phosphatase [Bacillota bacterium]|jgi:HPr kinase/phosphorylase|nr:HPr(Ser) kinase/phosphatase [Bacillota bacterium]NLL27149.1 HPr(Ser) kinase/phosphatase [Erysipelotrichia bacterium]